MKIILVSVGTRGDMEPFLALAHLLKYEGHSLACMFPEQFRGLVEEMGITFLSLGQEFINLLESEEGRLVMGGRGSVFKKAAAYFSLYRQSLVINRKMVNAQIQYLDQEAPDRVVYNGKSTGPLVWGCVHKGATILLSPVPYLIHAVYDHPHIGIGWSLGHSFNAWTYKLANFAFVQNIMSTTKAVRKQLGVDRNQIKKQLLDSELIYTISPALFQRPDYWPEQVKVLGYHERPKALTWQPNASLLKFVERHKKILFVTFGSMTNPDSIAKGEIVRSIAEKHQIPTIINRAAGGLSLAKDYDKSLMYITDRIPYDWVLPHVHAIVHHGGSGTTHMGLKYGCATMVIPHIIDQFVWNDIITKLGAGPRGVSIQKFSRVQLEPKILDLYSNHIYKKNAQEIAESMEQENNVHELIDSVVS